MNIIPTFPYPVFIDEYDIKEKFIEQLEEHWDETIREKDNPLFMFKGKMHECDELYDYVTEKAQFMITEVMGLKGEVDMIHTETHASNFGTIIPPHIHPNSYLTAYYMVQFDEDKGHTPLVINNPFYQSNVPAFRYESTKPTMWSSENFIPPLKEGNLIIFPSNLQHFFPKQDADDRIIVTFDFVAK